MGIGADDAKASARAAMTLNRSSLNEICGKLFFVKAAATGGSFARLLLSSVDHGRDDILLAICRLYFAPPVP